MNTTKTLIGKKVKFSSVPAPFYNEATGEQEFYSEAEEMEGIITGEYEGAIVDVKTENGDNYTTGEYEIIENGQDTYSHPLRACAHTSMGDIEVYNYSDKS